ARKLLRLRAGLGLERLSGPQSSQPQRRVGRNGFESADDPGAETRNCCAHESGSGRRDGSGLLSHYLPLPERARHGFDRRLSLPRRTTVGSGERGREEAKRRAKRRVKAVVATGEIRRGL